MARRDSWRQRRAKTPSPLRFQTAARAVLQAIAIAIAIISMTTTTTTTSTATFALTAPWNYSGGRSSSPTLQGASWSLDVPDVHNDTKDNDNDDDDGDDDNNSDDVNVDVDTTSSSDRVVPNCQAIRDALRDDYPELDTDLYSDAYLESVAAVLNRPLDYAIYQKIKGALEWRRHYGVESLRRAFDVVASDSVSDSVSLSLSSSGNDDDENGNRNYSLEEPNNNNNSKIAQASAFGGRLYVPRDRDPETSQGCDEDHENNNDDFIPSPELVEVCTSGAFVVLDEEVVTVTSTTTTTTTRGNEESSSSLGKNNETENGDDTFHPTRRLAVYADTSRLNWWKTGVTAGLHYHVLVLEDALDRIRRENNNNHNKSNDGRHCEGRRRQPNNNNTKLEESLVICVDTTAPPLLPPPLGVLKGFVQLLQGAYPDRIHKIYVGPISPLLRRLYEAVRPFLKPRSRNKIILLGEAPSELLETWKRSFATANNYTHTTTFMNTNTSIGGDDETIRAAAPRGSRCWRLFCGYS